MFVGLSNKKSPIINMQCCLFFLLFVLSLRATVTRCGKQDHKRSTAAHAIHCNALQLITTYCNTLQQWEHAATMGTRCNNGASHSDSMWQRTRQAINCNTCKSLQHTATHRSLLQHTATMGHVCQRNTTSDQLQHMQVTATYCNSLQHTAAQCNNGTYLPKRHANRSINCFLLFAKCVCVWLHTCGVAAKGRLDRFA